MTHRQLILILCLVLGAPLLQAQLIPGSAAEGLRAPREALEMRQEWWVGGTIAGGLHQAFGMLDVVYITSPVPEVPSAHARTEGGWGTSLTVAPAVEYRPYRSSFGILFGAGVEHSRMTSSSTGPISDLPYAYNATFETTVTTMAVVGSVMATWHVGRSGMMVMGGPIIDIPVSTDASVWQHEVLADSMSVGDEPGFPETNINYRTSIPRNVRVGVQAGAAINIMAGLFGYTAQLVTPYVVGQIATPLVSSPTVWHATTIRLGVLWRAGL